MILILLLFALFFLFLMFAFRDTQMMSDLMYNLRKKLVSPKRTVYTVNQSEPTSRFEVANSAIQNFSQLADGKLVASDFGLPSLQYPTSSYSDSITTRKKIKVTSPRSFTPSSPYLQSVSDMNLIENRRFYHSLSNHSQKYNNTISNVGNSSKASNTKNSPSNKQIFEAASNFHKNRTSSSLSQMFESAAKPPVLPAIVQKKAKKENTPAKSNLLPSTASSGSTSTATPTPTFAIPPPPSSSNATTGGSTGTSPAFNFDFNFNKK
ncbi:hypothetical protein TRFO_01154 [Tritrichomonas foetus]|uniref:Uncharacterized protein n=1 Tax=Tritrichomonas foetus TaxID=1144522 RepID=A0A1J4KND7_9EUKA|nr:hypothetical protein TRFO_01154 [Tritrichomonas foetus]|eukprot:OHT11214.1 hypothetical protein TRFO_01154 [Tritrichomonas foetus]